MTMPMRLMHFRTFARLGEANWSHVQALGVLAGKCAGGETARPDWAQLVGKAEGLVLVATECQLLVGAVAVSWRGGEMAQLEWLGVTPDARGRGVGSLLLASAIDLTRRAGAQRLAACLPEEATPLRALLLDMGYVEQADGALALALR